MRRRDALHRLLGAVALVPLGAIAQQDSAVGRLTDPALAGKPRSRVTDYENDPFVVGVEGQLRCTCGCNLSVYTCRTTDFTCETSPAMHRQVIELVEQGKTADEILGAFVAQHGETVLMAPPRRGFNLAGYLVPGLAILTAGALLLRRLVRETRGPGWSGVRGPGGERATPDTGHRTPDTDHAKIAAELERLEL